MKSKDRNTFIFNEDWGEAIDTAPVEEQLSIYRAIRKYAIYGEMPELPIYSTGIMCTIKLQIDRNRRKYNEVREKRSAAGKAGNLKRWGEKNEESQDNASIANATKCDNSEQKSQKVANIADNDNVNDNVNDNEINKPKGYERFNLSFIEDSYRDTFYRWLDYKKERREKYKTLDSLQTAYKKLKNLSNDNPLEAMEIVEQSIGNNWAGLFALKNHSNEINSGKIQKEGFGW